jgi:hypothetical protein
MAWHGMTARDCYCAQDTGWACTLAQQQIVLQVLVTRHERQTETWQGKPSIHRQCVEHDAGCIRGRPYHPCRLADVWLEEILLPYALNLV